ncbi:aromatic ring-hydroxylating dioxygenase subunit alpha [Verminephrobacter aporrectodeae subsp. tuberculatae]|uniref:Aromatic ring-hydroxylating dioxygenase subunit alpha n=1 Tax=Verminephrobacter aporrectodeae subsp. tuberculatae TaxID=1110392 RepID=A0ABT3KSJ9_9BURK|nr:aromatic ring-hydroxylating dioxygenase subunit alpha [Verminephrobacter aporrectodeae]MCW5321288.1 aromatic ring-hydroxylating dioxygenase subunit alpha [Verminephrobacter aporrectodeae subsp. tuberculatae]MCW8165465.1 aromatic ring-hydroxylating dioxygenase subunit alpha [Verminephrobacter aporrectodeae subsp. tuberculatae]MCW8170033.1 aromatic ring-hydroxylating dioxygenase subunit alpha [Verminephrobacter aporrectodeae subsp. tuberculatae]MCW8209103.1 aromatic ring-hydroxylating dioxygen
MNHPQPLSAHTLMVRDLLARRRPGYGLEAPFYLSEELFRADMEHIFGAHWIFVAVEPQIAEAGDYVTIDMGSRSILIVRSDDLQIRAFHNVCRHRGSRLCADRQGVLGNIVCPYHQWSYDLTGKLVHAKHMPDDFDFSDLNLRPVHVRSLLGLIFICLGDAPPQDFEQMATAMTPYLAPHQLQQCKVAAQVDLVENCNWKITMENNRECYHCLATHPELTVSLYEHGFGYKPDAHNADKLQGFQEILERSHARWEAMGLPSAEIDTLDERVTGFRTQRLPLDRCGQSQTLNTEVASKKLLADFVDPALGGLSFWTQPNSWHHFMSDHIISFSVLPITVGKTLVRTTWCVHKDAVEGVDYSVENLTAVWNATNDQDRRLVEESQIGIASGAYEPGPFSPFIEGLLDKFCNWYVQRLSALVR